MIMQDVDRHFEQRHMQELEQNTKILSTNLSLQLNTEIFKEFVNSFSLFKDLDTSIVKEIKFNSKIGNKQSILRKDTEINCIYLVIEG